MHKNTFLITLLTAFLLLAATTTQLQGGEIPDTELRQEIQDILAQEMPQWKPGLREKIIAYQTVIYLERVHFSPKTLNSELSARWYEEYFKSLDYQKALFLQEDLDEFRSYETILWDHNSRSVRISFAYDVYSLYLKRLREWTEYAISHLFDECDFSTAEYLEADSREQPWCTSRAQREDLWRRRVKNMLLAELLKQEKKQEKIADDSTPQADKPESEAPDAIVQAPEDSTSKPSVKRYTGKERLARTLARFYQRRCQDVNSIEILEIFLNSLCGLYDPHSAYMSPDTEEDFDISMKLSLEGIGATLSVKDSYITIVDIMPGSPAELSGQLQTGDRIVAVAQQGEEPVDVVDMSLKKAVKLIRGPKGTTVTLTILPEGSSIETSVSLVRDKIKVKNSEAQGDIIEEKLPDGSSKRLLLIYLPSFYCDFEAKGKKEPNYKSSSKDIYRLITSFEEQGPIDGIILDLRGNGGGALEEAIDLAGLFLPSSLVSPYPVVQIRDSKGRRDVRTAPRFGKTFKYPLAVMTDRLSASASEIVAACLQDAGRAVIFGDKSTHGKGTVQTVVELDQDPLHQKIKQRFNLGATGVVKFTVAKFYRISGGSTQERGVTPDVIFPSFTDYMELGENELPNVLPWDEIRPAIYHVMSTASKYRDIFRQKAEEYLNQNADYQEYLEDLKFFKEIHQLKRLPLQLEERRAFQEKEKKSLDLFKKFQAERKNSRQHLLRDDDDDDILSKDDTPSQDIILHAVSYAMANGLASLEADPQAAAE